MPTISVEQSIDNLSQYFPFNPSATEDVKRAAVDMHTKGIGELAVELNIQDGPALIPGFGKSHPIQVLEFTPVGDYQTEKVRILHSPMGTSINDFSVWNAATLFKADPTERLWLVGGPSSTEKYAGRLTPAEMGYIILTHNLRPTVDTLLRYANERGVTVTDHIGFSAASDKAATATQYSARYGQRVDRAVLADPATVVERSLIDLTLKFIDTGKQQRHYIEESNYPPYIERWDEDTRTDFLRYCARLLRPSNLTIAMALKHDGFKGRLEAAMDAQPQTIFTVGWGTNSELSCSPVISTMVMNCMQNPRYAWRLHAMPLEGMYHAGMNNPFLYALMMLHGLRVGRLTATEQIPDEPHSTDLDRAA